MRFSGGLIGRYEEQEELLLIEPRPSGHGAALFTQVKPADFLSFLDTLGLRLLGLEEIVELPPVPAVVWSPATFLLDKFDGWDAEQTWHRTAAALRAQSEYPTADTAIHIAFHLRCAVNCLRKASIGYERHLRRALFSGQQLGIRSTHIDDYEVFESIHGFFVEASMVRDHLSKFASRVIFQKPDFETYVSLLKWLRDVEAPTQLGEELISAGTQDSSGWLACLSRYRNNIIHGSPLVGATTANRFVLLSTGPVKFNLAKVVLEVPENPFASEEGDLVDALDLCVKYTRKLARLALQVVNESGVKPVDITIKPKNSFSGP